VESKILLWCKLSALGLMVLALLFWVDECGSYRFQDAQVKMHQASVNSMGELEYGLICESKREETAISVDSASYFRIQDRDSIALYSTQWRHRIRGFLDQRHPSFSQRQDPSILELKPLLEIQVLSAILMVLAWAVWLIQDFSKRLGIWFFALTLSAYLWWFAV